MRFDGFDLAAAARDEMVHDGFDPDFPPGTEEQLAAIRQRGPATTGLRDLRDLVWSSIDNDSSRDLDQIEWAEVAPNGTRVLVGIADVAQAVDLGSPIDSHAESQTTSVYTGVRTFPMLPSELSTDLTSLNEGGDRQALIIEFTVAQDGSLAQHSVYPALVRNHAQLTYETVGPWLEHTGEAPAKIAGNADLRAQLELQDQTAQSLLKRRQEVGALNFARTEAQPVIVDGQVRSLVVVKKNRASQLIEDFMIAANEVMARTLTEAHVASIRRVVKAPERWPRIVELASRYGEHLPATPDSGALNTFLSNRRTADPVHYPDVSLAVMKLMGPGEYVLQPAGAPEQGHFGLAAQDYTHSTAPNRRFADLVTQRLIKAVLHHGPSPFSDDRLAAIARNCTLKEDAARKVERNMSKRIAAVALQSRIGQSFPGVITGVTPKGTFVRVFDPPVEGRLFNDGHVDVGDQVRVKLTGADPRQGFIDFSPA